jgi:hypothetical protein
MSNTFSKIMTQNTYHERHNNGLKTIIFKSYPGQHSFQTSTLLNISGTILNANFANMELHPIEFMNYGID